MELGRSLRLEIFGGPDEDAESLVYETFRADQGFTPFLAQHVDRILYGIEALGAAPPMNASDLMNTVSRLLVSDLAWATRIRLDASRRSDHTISIWITGYELTGYDTSLGASPESLVTRTSRRDHGEARWTVKSAKNELNRNLRNDANKAGHFEGVFLSAEDEIYEGAFSNLFIVQDRRLSTPRSDLVLPGITRQLILELASGEGIPTEERRVSVSELIDADEVFITSAIIGIVPINRLEHNRVLHHIGKDARPITKRLSHLYGERRTSLQP